MQKKELEKDRQKIDLLDLKILRLLNERATLAVNIARIKSQNNMPIFIPERENSLLGKIIAKNEGPLHEEAIRNIFLSIMNESKKLQRTFLTENLKKKLNNGQK